MTDGGAPTADARLDLYLAGVAAHGEEASFAVPAETQGVLLSADSSLADFRRALARWKRGRAYLAGHNQWVEWVYRNYARPVLRTCAEAELRGSFLLRPGDTRDAYAIPTVAKSRPIADGTNAVLFPLNASRHFRPMREVEALDRPFRDKAARIVWRGATTGRFTTQPDAGSRQRVMDWVGRSPRIDVGYSELIPKLQALFRKPAKAALRPKLTIGEQLGARYLLSLEGNDVASGLKWMILSNSVVLMPPPTAESWFCERLLVPFRHYVPVAQDLSDLEATLDWCEANLPVMEEIVAASTAFARAFLDEAVEAELRRAVMRSYLERFTLVDGGAADPSAAAA